MKLTVTIILHFLSIAWPKTSATQKDDGLLPTSLEQNFSATIPNTFEDKMKDIAAELEDMDDDTTRELLSERLSEDQKPLRPSDYQPNFLPASQHLLVNSSGNLNPVNLSNTVTSTDDHCNRDKIKYEWRLQVVEFFRQLKSLHSLFRISLEDLILHLEIGTVEDSWVGDLVEHGKHLNALHADHNKTGIQSVLTDSLLERREKRRRKKHKKKPSLLKKLVKAVVSLVGSAGGGSSPPSGERNLQGTMQ